jgi:hypothetical protein
LTSLSVAVLIPFLRFRTLRNALSINSTSNVVTLNSYPLIDGGSVLIKLGSNTSTSGYTGIGAVATGLTINLGAAGTTGSLLFNTGASYSYTFPAATGTLALTSNLSSYLPLAGGTLTGALSGTSITLSSSFNMALNQSIYSNSGRVFLNNGSIYIGDIDNINPIGAVNIRQAGSDFISINNNIFTLSSGKTTLNASGGNVLIGTTTDDTTNKLQVNGQANINGIIYAGNNVPNLSTTTTNLMGANSRALLFAAWYNTSSGNQGSAVLMMNLSTGLTIISISDGSGCAVVFSALSGILKAQTTSGTVNISVSSIGV